MRTDRRTIVVARVYDSPRERLFDMWTRADHFSQWWGPKGFANSLCDIDIRRATWRTVTRSPWGVEYPLSGNYREVAANERIVITCDVSESPAEWLDRLDRHRGPVPGDPVPELTATVTFEKQGSKTKVTVRADIPTAADRAAYIAMGVKIWLSQSLERLADAIVEKVPAAEETFAPPRRSADRKFGLTGQEKGAR